MAKYVSDRERYDILFETVLTALKNDEDEKIIEMLLECHSADIAEIITDLEGDERIYLFSLLTEEQAAEVFAEVDIDDFIMLFSTLNRSQKTAVLDLMYNDDLADILGELPDNLRERCIKLLDEEDAEDINELLVYDEDSAGGIMTKDYIEIKASMNVSSAIEYLRQNAPDAETVYYVYVIDDNRVLVGIISLRQLLVSDSDIIIKDIMKTNVISARVDDDQKEVARLVSKYDFLALPVTDNDDKLVGIITVDDVIDIIEEEATEDILKFAGSSDEIIENYEGKAIVSVIRSIRARLPWLIITMFGGLLSGYVVSQFEYVIKADATLVFFTPLLTGMGGNVGTQSSTITVRNIAVNDIRGKETIRVIFHEVLVGIFVGLICASIVAVSSFMLKSRMILSVIVGIAMFSNIFTAAIIGTAVPLIFKKVGVDPAVASAPFITTTIDITGLSIYYSLAIVLILHFA